MNKWQRFGLTAALTAATAGGVAFAGPALARVSLISIFY
jgi:hypothetical protein